jgi:intracellular sulfur oxidation DsrE/DsrF family protein
MRVVLHAPANRVRVIQNARTLLGDDSVAVDHLAVVAHGGGVDLLVADGRFGEYVTGLLDRGVDVAACETSMRRQDVTAADLVDGVRTVETGLGEVTRLQSEGYQYLRP